MSIRFFAPRFSDSPQGARQGTLVLPQKVSGKVKQPLSRGAYRLLKAIKSYDFRRRGWSCPNQKTLAKDLGVDVSSIKRYTAELKCKNYLAAVRRPNTSSLYRFGLRSAQNEPTVGSQIEPTGKTADEPTIQLFLTGSNSSPSPTRKPPGKETHRMSVMPEYYTSFEDQKLWRMAQRWIHVNKPDLAGYLDRAAPIMDLLQKAGALNGPEAGPLPEIAWPPAIRPTPDSVKVQHQQSDLSQLLEGIGVAVLGKKVG